MTDLLEAVDALTKPTHVRHRQAKDGKVEHPPLLARLRAAISASLVGGANTSLPSTRIPIDPHALTVYQRIEHAIREAFVETTGQPPTLHPEDVLRAWYVRYMQRQHTEAAVAAWTARILGWVAEIERILDGPRVIEIDMPCIVCGQGEATNEQGELIRAVVVEYRPDPDGLDVTDVRTVCRACQNVLEGKHGASTFRRYGDEQAEQTTLYEFDVADERLGLKYEGARNIAHERFKQVGPLYGRICLTRTPTPEDRRWTFTAHIRDTPGEDVAITA